MSYQDTLNYIFAKLPMYSRTGAAAYKKDLTNTITLCNFLGNPQKNFKTIHVAGTNGKGSVSHMLASVLQANGYKTGLYTSPHLYDFRERIKLNGTLVPEEFVVDFVNKLKPLIEEIEPSFFEITVAMAFEYFKQKKVDVAVIEVGLGGRLDSTNIINPEVSVITNIGLDHTNLLGDTLEKIAVEKGGIIKEGVPVIIGERQNNIDTIFEAIAKAKKALIFFVSDNYKATNFNWNNNQLELTATNTRKSTEQQYLLDLPGIYQTKNCCTVLQTIDILNGVFNLNAEKTRKGLAEVKQNTGLHGRWEIIAEQPKIVLDVAHNESGIIELIRQLELETYEALHVVIGFVKDKDVAAVLNLLPKKAQYYFTQAHIPRALPAVDLMAVATKENLSGNVYNDVNSAIAEAKKTAAPNDLILVCGSIFLIAEVDKERL